MAACVGAGNRGNRALRALVRARPAPGRDLWRYRDCLRVSHRHTGWELADVLQPELRSTVSLHNHADHCADRPLLLWYKAGVGDREPGRTGGDLGAGPTADRRSLRAAGAVHRRRFVVAVDLQPAGELADPGSAAHHLRTLAGSAHRAGWAHSRCCGMVGRIGGLASTLPAIGCALPGGWGGG